MTDYGPQDLRLLLDSDGIRVDGDAVASDVRRISHGVALPKRSDIPPTPPGAEPHVRIRLAGNPIVPERPMKDAEKDRVYMTRALDRQLVVKGDLDALVCPDPK